MQNRAKAHLAIPLVVAALCALAAQPALAREGSSSKSIGQGIKCSTVAVLQSDGTIRYQQVCRKGV